MVDNQLKLSPPAPEPYNTSSFQEGRTIVQFRDNELLFTDLGGRPADPGQKSIMQDAQKKQYSGRMSQGAQKRMGRAITLMTQITKGKWVHNTITGRHQFFRLSMITLTVSDRENVDHRTAYKKLLSPFLNWIRYTKGCRHYVWKAELQERGQIHYHLVLPLFVDYREVRKKWNSLQRDAGLLRGYVSRTKNPDPNSTDIHAVGNERRAAKYCMKYLGKGADSQAVKAEKEAQAAHRRGEITAERLKEVREELDQLTKKINGKVWDCSEALNEKYFTALMTWRLGMVLQDYVKDHPDHAYYGERFMFLQMDFSDPPDFMLGVMPRFRMYLDYIRAGGKKAMLN